MMKFFKQITILFCSLFVLSCSQSNDVTNASTSGSTTMTDANGQAISSDSFKGKWVVINYWADWCVACMEEVPELNQFYQDEKGKNVVFYGVNYDGLTDQDLKTAIVKSNIEFPVAMGDFRTIWNLSRVDYLPTTFIINPNGKVVRKLVGSSTEEALLDVINSAKP